MSDMSAFDRPFVFNELVDRFARSEAELTNARADARALRDALDTAQKAKESWPRDVQIAQLKADVVNERANANNLGVSLNRLRLQANGWKEENEQLRKELAQAQAVARDLKGDIADYIKDKKHTEELLKAGGYYINDLVTAQEEKERLLVLNEELAKENERAKIAIAEKNRMLDERMARINELNAGIARAQDVRQDRQTDARLFLELIHLGRTVNDARAAVAAANDIRKNGLTPQT